MDLSELTRKPERGGDRALLDAVLDETHVGVLSTVTGDGMPWSVPMLTARDGDRLIIHGSSGAGAVRRVAAGTPATFTAFVVDGLVVADTLFDHSVNYRSVVIRGTLTAITEPEDAARALDALSDAILPGRSEEMRAHTRKELAATTVLALPIVDGHWLAKTRAGGPGPGGDGWTGHIPMHTAYGAPITENPGEVPESVRRLGR